MESDCVIHLTLIRHGITSYNIEKRYLGHTDIPVIEERLKEFQPIQGERISTVYSSDLWRCRQTASYLFSNHNIQLDARLREMNFGDYEGKTYEQLKNLDHYRRWISDWEHTTPPNGESGTVFQQRIQQFMEEEILQMDQCGRSLAIVSHGGVIRYIVSSLCNVPFWEIEVPHGEAIEMSVRKVGGHWTCTLL